MGKIKVPRLNQFMFWLKKQPKKVKTVFAVSSIILAIVVLSILNYAFGDRYYQLFAVSEGVLFAGLLVLIYKLKVNKNCSGLSLKTQELTAVSLLARIISTHTYFFLTIHCAIDLLNLLATAWVIYMIRFKLKSSYIKDLDNFPRKILVPVCLVLAVLIHPYMLSSYLGISWAFSAYLEAVSVLPQLRLMRNSKVAEPFTAHYVFALGVSRFFGFAYWAIQVYRTGGRYIFKYESTFMWYPAALIAELIQTFILADFCYYYVKSYIDGQFLMKIPV